MAQNRKTARTISLREDSVVVPERMPDLHRIWFGALTELCADEGSPMYFGKWTNAGRISFRIYADDAQLEGFLLASDDPAKVITAVADRVFGPAKAEALARLAVRRLAGKPSAAREEAR